MVAILLGADNGFFYAGQIMHFSSTFTVFLIYHKHIYMNDFEDYYAFADKFAGTDGNPRYTEEDYIGFCECAPEWFVLDSGNGEFSTDVPLGKAVRIRIPKKVY